MRHEARRPGTADTPGNAAPVSGDGVHAAGRVESTSKDDVRGFDEGDLRAALGMATRPESAALLLLRIGWPHTHVTPLQPTPRRPLTEVVDGWN
jgi:hypothetical protein